MSRSGPDQPAAGTRVPRRFQPRLAKGFDIGPSGDGLRPFDREVTAWLLRPGEAGPAARLALLAVLLLLLALLLA